MTKVNSKHLKTIDRAIVVLRLTARRQKMPRFRKEWERDIIRLKAVRRIVEATIKFPKLDFYEGNVSDGSTYAR